MKQTIFFFLLFALFQITNAQQESELILVKPVAMDRLFWLSSPQQPKQVFIVEVQDTKGGLIKVIFFPKTDGLRGGVTEFVDPKTLNKDTFWKLKLRSPLEEEKRQCMTDNYLRTSKNKVHTNESGEPTLRFRSTQMEADIEFKSFSEMPCMVLESFSK